MRLPLIMLGKGTGGGQVNTVKESFVVTVINRLRKGVNRGPNWAILIALIILVIVGAFSSPYFLTSRNIFNIFRQASPLAIVSVGQTFLILSGGIDLSVGSIISLTSSVACMLMIRGNEWTIPAIIIVLLIGAGVGFLNGLIVNLRKVPSFVVTLGMMTVVHGITLIITGGYPKGRASRSLLTIGEEYIGPVPFLAIAAAIILFVSWYILKKTVFGRHTYAVGANPMAANLSGIKIQEHSIKVFTFCGLTAALAGLSLAARIGIGDPFVGSGFELDSIAAVVMGGTALSGGIGGMGGTMIGVLLMGTINNLLNLLNVSGFFQHVIKGLVLIIAVSIYKKK